MPPAKKKTDERESMAIFTPGRNLGSVGHAFMDAAIDLADGNIIDVNTGELVEEYLNNKDLAKLDALKGKLRPLGMEHVHVLEDPKKKK